MNRNERYGVDLAEMVQQTLEVLESTGGEVRSNLLLIDYEGRLYSYKVHDPNLRTNSLKSNSGKLI